MSWHPEEDVRHRFEAVGGATRQRSWILLIVVSLSLSAILGLGLYRATQHSTPNASQSMHDDTHRPMSQQQDDARVSIAPRNVSIETGEQIELDLRIDDVTDLYGIEVRLGFDPSIVQVEDGIPGTSEVELALGDFSREFEVLFNTVDGGSGAIRFGLVRVAEPRGVSGSGVLASAHFLGRVEGSTDLAIERADLYDSGSNRLAVTVEAGRIEVQRQATSTPRPTPTRASPSTPGWRPRGSLPDAPIRYVEQDADGNTWYRLIVPNGRPDRVAVIDPAGGRRDFVDLRSAVQATWFDIRRVGSLRDFWAVDRSGGVWVGAQRYDGSGWSDLSLPAPGALAELRTQDRVVLDASDGAWTPTSLERDCIGMSACGASMINRVSGNGGTSQSLVPAMRRGALQLGQDRVHLLTLEDGQAAVVTASEAFFPPEVAPMPYPGGVGEASAFEAQGATAATMTPDGRLQIFLIREVRDAAASALGLRTELLAFTWQNEQWHATDLSDAPFLSPMSPLPIGITAAAYDPDGRLWLGASNAQLAAWHDGNWGPHFTRFNSPIEAPIRDLVGTRAGVIVGNADGAHEYRDGRWTARSEAVLPILWLP